MHHGRTRIGVAGGLLAAVLAADVAMARGPQLAEPAARSPSLVEGVLPGGQLQGERLVERTLSGPHLSDTGPRLGAFGIDAGDADERRSSAGASHRGRAAAGADAALPVVVMSPAAPSFVVQPPAGRAVFAEPRGVAGRGAPPLREIAPLDPLSAAWLAAIERARPPQVAVDEWLAALARRTPPGTSRQEWREMLELAARELTR